MNSEIVIAMYRPFDQANESALRELIRQHNTTLRVEEMITERPAILMQAEDGTYIEIFEWLPGAAEAAHEHPAIQKIWKRMQELCDFAPLISLPEAEKSFPHFKPLEGIVT
ncbi:MAG: hypothetical protein R3E76_12650 [Planctomycetota bacterium]